MRNLWKTRIDGIKVPRQGAGLSRFDVLRQCACTIASRETKLSFILPACTIARCGLRFMNDQSRRLTISQTLDVAALTVADFEPRLRDEFNLSTSNGEIPLELAEVRLLGTALRSGGAFSLLFVSPRGPFLPQGIYPLAHPVMGTMELFIVPIGPTKGANGYEAVFT
jgi:hypothetical protein